ncbi:MAG TPA: phenylacetate--CoA ligase family protein [Polyangiaceae bacterium]|nr:phenylacetate--CoA ligase family protein [Polyangiaceae bacterium]
MSAGKANVALTALGRFYETPIDHELVRHLSEPPDAASYELFVRAAHTVPAYELFLKEQSFEARDVRGPGDYRRVPVSTKENYHRRYSLTELCREGQLSECDMLAVSSGSTGEPAIWPRFVTDELGTAFRFEQVLRDAFRAHERRTLAVVCFALGSWVGGMYTTACLRHVAAKGYPLTLVTPGNQKAEILRVLRALVPSFEQVVLCGYPPFLKDVIDSGRADGFDWHAQPVKLVMAGEVFSEEWRSVVCERLGARAPELDTASLYGTADGGVLANETPLSIAIRRHLAKAPELARQLFAEARLPTLCQYDPLHRYFEGVDGDLLFSGDGGIPLLRYKILDRGGIHGFASLTAAVRAAGFDAAAELLGRGVTLRELPFVHVFGRSNFALSFYGANVYPENVAVGIEQPALLTALSGKFVLQVVHDTDQNPLLDIAIELLPGQASSAALAGDVAASIQRELERLNSEFKNYAPADRRQPRVRLLPHADPDYFPVGVKHRYTRA